MNKFVIKKSIFDKLDFIEKGRSYDIGTIREWHGEKYKKVGPGNWQPVREGKKGTAEELPKSKKPAKSGPEPEETKKEAESYTPKSIKTVSLADNYDKNQEVEFNFGGNKLSGKITAKGKQGVTIHDKDDNIYHVDYNAITNKTKNSDGTIPADKFKASDYNKSFADEKAKNTPEGIEYIYNSLGEDGDEIKEEAKKIMNKLDVRMMENGSSKEQYTDKDGNYTPERQKLHDKIIESYFTDEKIRNATPKPGEKPKLVLFGGRGGSGKSWFSNDRKAKNGWNVKFDENNFIKLDSDEIKKELIPPYEGWNAGEVHAESDYLKVKIQNLAKEKGLNILIDGTMSWYAHGDSNWLKDEAEVFKNDGYSLEAHYMYVPVQTSTKRGILRFANKETNEDSVNFGKNKFDGRFVPVNILLSMQDNEKTFESLKDMCDDWSFSDNQGDEPVLVSRKGL